MRAMRVFRGVCGNAVQRARVHRLDLAARLCHSVYFAGDLGVYFGSKTNRRGIFQTSADDFELSAVYDHLRARDRVRLGEQPERDTGQPFMTDPEEILSSLDEEG